LKSISLAFWTRNKRQTYKLTDFVIAKETYHARTFLFADHLPCLVVFSLGLENWNLSIFQFCTGKKVENNEKSL
jgi:hypothetical protein